MSKDSEYKKLRSIWYRKLRKKGFKDVEAHLSHHPTSPASTWYLQTLYTPEQFEEHSRYYQLAGQMLYEYPFANKMDKAVWALHAEGRTVRDIGKAVGLSVEPVQSIIKRLAGHIVKR
jgi:hypothetical protein